MKRLQEALSQLSPAENILTINRVPGGDSNEAYKVLTSKGQYFVKVNEVQPISYFLYEAQGLDTIAKSSTIHVPNVMAVFGQNVRAEDNNAIVSYKVMEWTGPSMLWLEWIESEKTDKTQSILGEHLAFMHLQEGFTYGLNKDGFIGNLPQKNIESDNWLTYYRDIRLYSQIQLGQQLGYMPPHRFKKIMVLLDQLHRWIPPTPKKSLLHGDLWAGNWMPGPNGMPYLIDPAYFYGHHEMDLAFTELFGGYSSTFYEAYEANISLDSTYAERKKLYQLYYLLVHLNLFGESYGAQVDQITRHYVG